MNTHKEFQGKTLDDAIKEACDYYGVAREKLEIEIVSDAKMGIFGLVGVKKAVVRASRADLSSLMEDAKKGKRGTSRETVSAETEGGTTETSSSRKKRGKEESAPSSSQEKDGEVHAQPGEKPAAKNRSTAGSKKAAPKAKNNISAQTESSVEGVSSMAEEAVEAVASESGAMPARSFERQEEKGEKNGRSSRGSRNRKNGRAAFTGEKDDAARHAEGDLPDSARDDLPEISLEDWDEQELEATVLEVVDQLVAPIVGEFTRSVSFSGNRARVSLSCGESSGLLVGREGQTLASIQYIAGRILARRLGGSIRLQFDADNYRERQDERLRELALSLAEKAKAGKRSFSTRPLSAYQRRIVHLALEGDDMVQTFSKGEGAQRRVIIQPEKKAASNAPASGDSAPLEGE